MLGSMHYRKTFKHWVFLSTTRGMRFPLCVPAGSAKKDPALERLPIVHRSKHVAAPTRIAARDHLPSYKDQCRSVIAQDEQEVVQEVVQEAKASSNGDTRTKTPKAKQRKAEKKQVDRPPAESTKPRVQTEVVRSAPSLHFNVQIHISPDATSEQIEQVFSSMGKHLKQLST